jgi:hypothetical protein
MKRWLLLTGGFVSAALLSAGLAAGQTQQKAAADCKKPLEKVEGQVMTVDPGAGKVVVRDKSGATHEFHASAETLKDMKPGDSIEARLREAPKC